MLRRATVVENLDPLGRARIKVRFNNTEDPPENLPWVSPCVPYGGWDNADGSGWYWIPSVGSQVWVAQEEETGALVWIGQTYFGEGGLQNAPIEAQTKRTEPLVRVLKSLRGHKLIFDDRIEGDDGSRTIDIRLLNANDNGLTISDHLGIELRHSNARFNLRESNLNVHSGRSRLELGESGFLVRTPWGGIQLTSSSLNLDHRFDVNLSLRNHKLSLKGDFSVETPMGNIDARGANVKLFSGGDTTISTAASLRANANTIDMAALVDGAIACYVPSSDGRIASVTIDDGVQLRVGVGIDTDRDLIDPTATARITLKDNISIEGRHGGIHIFDTAQTGPGVAGGTVRLTGAVLPESIQPAVLGDNLRTLLSDLIQGIDQLLQTMLNSAANFATSPAGPAVLSPAIAAQIGILRADIARLRSLHLDTANLPTGILSGVVYLEG